jgi:hypothetical protein
MGASCGTEAAFTLRFQSDRASLKAHALEDFSLDRNRCVRSQLLAPSAAFAGQAQIIMR